MSRVSHTAKHVNPIEQFSRLLSKKRSDRRKSKLQPS